MMLLMRLPRWRRAPKEDQKAVEHFVPTHQQVVYQRRAIEGLSIAQVERELMRRGCRWVDVAAPPEGFYRRVKGDIPNNWTRSRSIMRGDYCVGTIEGYGNSDEVIRSALAYVRAQDEFKDRNDWPPGMEPPRGPVSEPWSDVYESPQWLIHWYQDVMTIDRRPDPIPSFDLIMEMAVARASDEGWDTSDSILLQEFEVNAFPEEDARGQTWSHLFYFSKALRGPDDRIVWPGDETWIDAPVRKVSFFFLPEEYWHRHLERETTHNPPTVDLKWPWKKHIGVQVD